MTRDLFFLLKCRFLGTPKNLRRNKFINGNLKRKSVASCRKKIRNQIKFKYRQNRKDLYPIGKRKEIFIRYKSVFEFMLSIDSMSSTMIPVSSHPAPDTAKIWLIRSERDCYWLALNTASTMLRGVGKGESRWGEEGGPLEFSTLVKHRQTPRSREDIRKFDLAPVSKYLSPTLRRICVHLRKPALQSLSAGGNSLCPSM